MCFCVDRNRRKEERMPLKQHRIMAMLLAIGVCGALAPGGAARSELRGCSRKVAFLGIVPENLFFEALELTITGR